MSSICTKSKIIDLQYSHDIKETTKIGDVINFEIKVKNISNEPLTGPLFLVKDNLAETTKSETVNKKNPINFESLNPGQSVQIKLTGKILASDIIDGIFMKNYIITGKDIDSMKISLTSKISTDNIKEHEIFETLNTDNNIQKDFDDYNPRHRNRMHNTHKNLLTINNQKSSLTTINCKPISVPSKYGYPLCEKNNKVTVICPKLFKDKGRNGIIIDSSGNYVLGGNIHFNPKKYNVQAITITASNVTLDLGSHVIAQVNTQPGVYGIAIARDVNNVKITGSESVAEIVDFTLAGIRVMGRTKQILIENVTVTQTKPVYITNDILPDDCIDLGCAPFTGGIYVGEGERSGYAFYGTDKKHHVKNLKIDHVTVKNCMYSQIVETYGIQIDNSSFVENTYIGLLVGDLLPILGDEPDTVETVVAADITIRNSHFDRNINNNTLNLVKDSAFLFHVVTGITVADAKNVVVENSTFNSNSCDNPCLGFEGTGVTNISVRDCVFDANISLVADFAFGFYLSDSIAPYVADCVGIDVPPPLNQSASLFIERCTANGNQNFGFALLGVEGACIIDCTANNNFNIFPDFPVSGFLVRHRGTCSEITFLRCTASNNGNIGDFGTAAGFIVRSNCRKLTFRDCVASNNGQSNVNPAGAGTGFFLNPENIGTSVNFTTQDIIFDNCIANGNGTPQQTAIETGGILLRAPTNRHPLMNILIQDCTLAYNIKGIFAVNDIPGLVIKRCEADQNFVLGFDLTNVTSPKLVTKNIAYANGPAGVVNYMGVPAANIVTYPLDALPDGTVVGFKNLAITY